MKKIISSAIAVAMLSSTVAMAAYVAPTPQIETISATQTFDTFNSINTWKDDYEIGKDKLGVHSWNNEVTVVPNPFNDNTEDTDPDKVISMACPTVNTDDNDSNNKEGETGFFMSPGVTLNDGDIFKVSFDAVLTEPDKSTNNQIVFLINGKTVFDLYNHGNLDKVKDWADVPPNDYVFSTEMPDGNAFKNYEITFDKAANTIGIKIGGYYRLFNIKDDAPFNISSIKTVALKFQHKDKVTQGTFYLNNLSYETVRATSENLETFDKVEAKTAEWSAFSGELSKTKYNFPNGAVINNTQNIDPARGNVLRVDRSCSHDSYIAMPLNYTIDNDDVFTFKFDYYHGDIEQDIHTYMYLNDFSENANATRNFTAKGVAPDTKDTITIEQTRNNSCLFHINRGNLEIFGLWAGGALSKTNTFYTITVVIDNSDDEYDNQCTLAVYVNDDLVTVWGGNGGASKWIIEDNATDVSQKFTNIDGVSFKLGYDDNYTRCFDNMYATLTDKKISVDEVGSDFVASYTYPVVYADETAANADTNSIFVKAYYDASGRLISADTEPAKPGNYSRTATTTLAAPVGTVRTKVFRWDSLTGIKKLSPAYDSNPPSNSGAGE